MDTSPVRFEAFLSYARSDDHYENGRITALRRALSAELEVQSARPFPIFQDTEHIHVGQQWRKQIESQIEGTTVLIAIVTPAFLANDACRDEVMRFRKAEQKRGRDDLIIPVIYIGVDKVVDSSDEVAGAIASRQPMDWSELRFEPLDGASVRRAVANLARKILETIERVHATNRDGELAHLTLEVTESDDDIGFVEMLAASEEAMSLLHDSMMALAEGMQDFGNVIDEGTQQLDAARRRIEEAIAGALAFIPILTPSFFGSENCLHEVELFLEREKSLGRDDLIFPVHYGTCAQLTDPSTELHSILADRQRQDWRGLRLEEPDSRRIDEKIAELGAHIIRRLGD